VNGASAGEAVESTLRLVVWIGSPDVTPNLPGVRGVAVHPTSTTPGGVIDAVRDSGITGPDLKVRAIVMVDPDAHPMRSVASYAALTVLAGRRLDVVCGERVLELDRLDRALRAAPTPPRPEEVPTCIQVGAEHPDLPSFQIDGPALAPEALVALRHARHVRLVVGDNLPAAFTSFVAIAALRSRAGQERFPLLVRGGEAPDPEPLPDGVLPRGFDLDTVRAGAFELKRALRASTAASTAPRVPPTPRQQSFAAAADADIESVLAELGTTSPDGVLWHCPRPLRHTNGDANASMKVEDNRARCFRCDAEPVDPLRLVADVLDVPADDAALWIARRVSPVASS
jgi:hypothetical protein